MGTPTDDANDSAFTRSRNTRLRSVLATLSVLALKRARQRWESARIDLDGAPVRRARDIDLDVVGLMVCVAATRKMIGNGTAFGPGSVMVVPPAHQIRVTSPLGVVEWISALIRFSGEYWDRFGELQSETLRLTGRRR